MEYKLIVSPEQQAVLDERGLTAQNAFDDSLDSAVANYKLKVHAELIEKFEEAKEEDKEKVKDALGIDRNKNLSEPGINING